MNTAANSALGKMIIRYCKETGLKTLNLVRGASNLETVTTQEMGDFALDILKDGFETQL